MMALVVLRIVVLAALVTRDPAEKNSGPGGPAYSGPGGPRYNGPGGPAYDGPGGPAYSGPGGRCYAGPGGPCYSGPGGDGKKMSVYLQMIVLLRTQKTPSMS